jgi:hypothetical protein
MSGDRMNAKQLVDCELALKNEVIEKFEPKINRARHKFHTGSKPGC